MMKVTRGGEGEGSSTPDMKRLHRAREREKAEYEAWNDATDAVKGRLGVYEGR